MLSENIKNARKAKGLSQQELAIKLNVVRQTVSKWEKGLSVPDSETLVTLSEVLEIPVGVLLGESIDREELPTLQSIAAKLELLNEQFAKRAERSRRIWRTVFLTACAFAALVLLFQLVSLIYFMIVNVGGGQDAAVGVIGGADGPTAIMVSSVVVKMPTTLICIILLVISGVGLAKTK